MKKKSSPHFLILNLQLFWYFLMENPLCMQKVYISWRKSSAFFFLSCCHYYYINFSSIFFPSTSSYLNFHREATIIAWQSFSAFVHTLYCMMKITSRYLLPASIYVCIKTQIVCTHWDLLLPYLIGKINVKKKKGRTWFIDIDSNHSINSRPWLCTTIFFVSFHIPFDSSS